jgi:DNA-binding NarL/FixJ family response regulator
MRILIVADHGLAVLAIRHALRYTPGMQFIGSVDGRTPVSRLMAELNADVVLVDEMRDANNAVERIREIAQRWQDVKIVALATRMEDAWLDRALEAGADAAVCKMTRSLSIGGIVREVATGTVRMSRGHMGVRGGASTSSLLTERELEVLRHVALGNTNARIAAELSVTEQTIKFHLGNLYRKIGAANRTEATRYAFMNGLVVGAPEQMAEVIPLPTPASLGDQAQAASGA